MNYNNKNSVSLSFLTSSWGTFSSRYDRQPKYKNSENTTGSNLNEENNSQNQSKFDGNDFKDFKNSGGDSFNTNACGNQMNNIGDNFYLNSKNFGSQQNFSNFGSQQNSSKFESQQNFNNFGSLHDSSNCGSQQNSCNSESQQNSKSFGFLQNSSNFGSQQNSSNFGPQQNSSNFVLQQNSNNFESKQNQGNSNYFKPQQNRSNSNSFGPQKYQSYFNNANNSKNQSVTWLSGSGKGSNNNANGGNNNSSNYVPFRKFKQHFTSRPSEPSNDNSSAPALFMGRDQSYPNELNALMNPFFCGVCNSRLNSIKSANIHYESKAHDKHITNWMKKNFADKGLAVPEVQRFVTEETVGPYRCELCKIDLTSAQHALQHNNGRRHRQAASKISPPTGIGYYNVDGDWVETGKVLDKVTGKEASYILVNTPSGFEPVVLHVASKAETGVKRTAELNANNSEVSPEKKQNLEVQPHDVEMEKLKMMKEEQYRTMITDYEKTKQQENSSSTPKTDNNKFKAASLVSPDSTGNIQTPQEALNSQQCKICGIATTSYDQMLLHLKGIRHTKKLRLLGEPPLSDMFDKTPTSILASLDSTNPSDVSIYRTPSGSYYCKTCNVSQEDVARIKKHISSKAHLAAVRKSADVPMVC
ncbi:probable serine/threonine-protein kinase clkA [Eupeodes corollae]|uniref:probable serine/threonine-protein kinase clkA n=1 Tax=Eupeodes corollae TaxID=290404 RepID=UPI0024903433|nr:probable serine/threonine-protein kinase clkA [Eupeodes corollae]